MGNANNRTDELDQSWFSNRLFLIAILLGIALRLVAGVWGDIGVYVDGASRIAMAMRWAEHPVWHGLSGVWPPAHLYFLGILIRLWNQPILLAKLIGFICGVATLFVFRNACRHRFGPTVASLSALLLAVYWTHIWLGSSYWVEVPYLLFVLLAVDYAEKTVGAQFQSSARAQRFGGWPFFDESTAETQRTRRLRRDNLSNGVTNDNARTTRGWQYAIGSGLFLSLAMLLRNEALLLLVLFSFWYLLRIRDLKIFALFVTLPALLAAWYFIEPTLHGGSYFDYFSYVAKSKEFENLVESISRKEALYQWALMLGASPTLFVVVPGLYGLWENRRRALTDLFAWMFVAQVAFYFSLTLVWAWRPQLRYLMLQFVNLLPYAALVWLKIMRRFSVRYTLAAMLALMIGVQSMAWWIGRNNRLPGGWLPLQVVTTPQKIIDEWVGKVGAHHQPPIRIASLVPGPRVERWALEHSFVVNRLNSERSSLNEIDVHTQPEILTGKIPEQLKNADVILIDPQAVYYSTVLNAISREKPDRVVKRVHPHIEAILLTERARSDLGL